MENNNTQTEYPPFILRKNDFSILVLDEGTNLYSFRKRRGDTLPSNTYTLETLRDTYSGSFCPVYTDEERKQIEEISKKYYHSFISVKHKNDGHGGVYSEFNGEFIDYIRQKGETFTPSEFVWSDEKIYSKNDIVKLKEQILKKKEIIIRRLAVIEADEVRDIIDEFLKTTN